MDQIANYTTSKGIERPCGTYFGTGVGHDRFIIITLTVAGFELQSDGFPLLVDVVLRLEALILAEEGLGGALLEGGWCSFR